MTFNPIQRNPQRISTPRPNYNGIVAGQWKMPKKPAVTNIYIQNNFNTPNYWDQQCNCDQDSGGFWSKLADWSSIIGLGTAAAGTFIDLFKKDSSS